LEVNVPWEIRKEKSQYCVFKQGTSEKAGCHKTRKEATGQLKALYANESEMAVINFNVSDIEDAVYHLKLALELQIELAQEDDELIVHLQEALAFLGEVEDDSDDALLASTEGMKEYAWEGPIVFENILTGDKRIFKSDSINWESETLPWAFRWQKHSGQGHAGSVPVGRVDRLERKEDGEIHGRGVVIPALSDEAAEYLRLLESGVGGGVSVDGDSAQFEIMEMADGQPQIEFSSMRLRALSAVDIPAFNGARIKLVGQEVSETINPMTPVTDDVLLAVDDDNENEAETAVTELVEAATEEISEVEASEEEVISDSELIEELARKTRKKKMSYGWKFDGLVASAIPDLPSTESFIEPTFDGPTPLTVTKDGKVFGHLALFNTCHIGFPGTCVKPPKGSKYQYFHTGQIETVEGDFVDVGHLTFNTGHASMQANPKAAAQHYDNTGTVAADVRAGEDQFGIWVTGALRSHLTDADIRAFRAAPLSGDWRRISGKLELVGALAVNVPGFPVPRVKALVASGETETLFTFLEDDDEEFIWDYETQLRLDKKASLAMRLSDKEVFAVSLEDFLSEDDDDLDDVSEDDVLDIEELPELPSTPSKKDITALAEDYTKEQLLHDLQDVRDLLDDPDETIGKEDRKNLELLYEMFIQTKDGKKITASGEDVIEFYNSCHGASDGKFCPTGGKGGGGGVSGKADNRGGGGGGGRGPRSHGGGGGRPQHQGGGGGGRPQHQGNRPPQGNDRDAADRSKALTQLENYQKSKVSAKRWATTAVVATVANIAARGGILGPLVAPISPLLANPAVLIALTGVGIFQAGKQLNNARSNRRDFTSTISKVNKRAKIDAVIRQQRDKQNKIV
jgi:hypothetical protein